MHTVKIHLEDEEYLPLLRASQELGVTVEDVAYTGLNRVMMQMGERETRDDVWQTKSARKAGLPIWADHARSVHAYESME